MASKRFLAVAIGTDLRLARSKAFFARADVWNNQPGRSVISMNKTIKKSAEYQAQLARAKQLAKEKGLDALLNPHARTGRMCGCGDCFCCAALEVWSELRLAA